MPWLTTEEAAEILDYHPESVRRMLRKGQLQSKKFGRTWMIEKASIDTFQASLGSNPKTDPRRGK